MSEIDIGIGDNVLRIKFVADNDSVDVYWDAGNGFQPILNESTDPMWQYAADEKSGNDSGRLKMTVSEWWEIFTAKITALILALLGDAPTEFTAQEWEAELKSKIDMAVWINDQLV